jgi:rhodanese-related sulfurtransferase
MDIIQREELKAKLDRGDDFKLVMALGEWAYRAKHIPGSLNYATVEEALQALKPEDEIVVYCSDVHCPASAAAYHMLRGRGYGNVRRYAGGLLDWEAAGYPLEGDWDTEMETRKEES